MVSAVIGGALAGAALIVSIIMASNFKAPG